MYVYMYVYVYIHMYVECLRTLHKAGFRDGFGVTTKVGHTGSLTELMQLWSCHLHAKHASKVHLSPAFGPRDPPTLHPNSMSEIFQSGASRAHVDGQPKRAQDQKQEGSVLRQRILSKALRGVGAGGCMGLDTSNKT